VRGLFVRPEDGTEDAAGARRAALRKRLPADEAARVARLEDRKRYILAVADENRNLAGALLHDELAKLDEMVSSFVELACSAARWERHLKAVDWAELESDTRRHEQDAARARDPEHRALARKNLEVLLQRREQLEDLQRKVGKARGQLDLIESTFQLLGNQVILMGHPRELGGMLDDLRAGVEAVAETTVETATGDRERD
jgi:hypothetical protein